VNTLPCIMFRCTTRASPASVPYTVPYSMGQSRLSTIMTIPAWFHETWTPSVIECQSRYRNMSDRTSGNCAQSKRPIIRTKMKGTNDQLVCAFVSYLMTLFCLFLFICCAFHAYMYELLSIAYKLLFVHQSVSIKCIWARLLDQFRCQAKFGEGSGLVK